MESKREIDFMILTLLAFYACTSSSKNNPLPSRIHHPICISRALLGTPVALCCSPTARLACCHAGVCASCSTTTVKYATSCARRLWVELRSFASWDARATAAAARRSASSLSSKPRPPVCKIKAFSFALQTEGGKKNPRKWERA